MAKQNGTSAQDWPNNSAPAETPVLTVEDRIAKLEKESLSPEEVAGLRVLLERYNVVVTPEGS